MNSDLVIQTIPQAVTPITPQYSANTTQSKLTLLLCRHRGNGRLFQWRQRVERGSSLYGLLGWSGYGSPYGPVLFTYRLGDLGICVYSGSGAC